MSTTRWPAAGLSPMFVPRHDSSGCPVAAYLFSRDGMQPWFNPVGRVGWSSVVSGLTDCPICWGSQAAASQLPPCRPLYGCWKLCSASVLYRSRISTWHCWPMWLEPLTRGLALCSTQLQIGKCITAPCIEKGLPDLASEGSPLHANWYCPFLCIAFVSLPNQHGIGDEWWPVWVAPFWLATDDSLNDQK